MATDDINLASSADHLGLSIVLIDENWRREPQLLDEQTRIQKLEKDLDTYRQQEPVIICEILGLDEGDKGVTSTIVEAQPLTRSPIVNALETFKAKHPMRTNFTVPLDEIHGVESIETLERWTYIASSGEAISKYQNEDYPAWLSKCQNFLETLYQAYSNDEEIIVLTFEFENVGTRPAEDAKIEFRCDGDIAIRRPDDDDEDSEVSSQPAPRTWKLPAFDPPSVAPEVECVVHRAPFIRTSNSTKGLDIATLATIKLCAGRQIAHSGLFWKKLVNRA